jgi:hypothetical protein
LSFSTQEIKVDASKWNEKDKLQEGGGYVERGALLWTHWL